MLFTTIGITVVAAIGLLGWRLLRDDPTTPTATAATWNRVALIDRTTGAVVAVDVAGAATAEIPGTGRVTAVHAHQGHLALVGVGQITIIDIAAPDAPAVLVPIPPASTVTPITTPATMHLLVGSPTGGNVLIVDITDGSVLDVAALAAPSNPLMFPETVRWAADGSAFAVADAANFQTIVVRPGHPGAVFLADQPIAIADGLVATSQTVGLEADVALVDLERRRLASVPSPIPAGGAILDGRLVYVSTDGAVLELGPDDETADELGRIPLPPDGRVRWVRPALDRFVVAGDNFVAVIGQAGGTLFDATVEAPIEIPLPGPDWTCLTFGGAGRSEALISLTSGERLADLTGLVVTGTSADGCTVIGTRAGVTEIVSATGTVSLGRVRTATLSPDGRSVVTTSSDGRTELRTLTDGFALSQPVDLTAAAGSSPAIAFLGN